jgi:hypothetical protein
MFPADAPDPNDDSPQPAVDPVLRLLWPEVDPGTEGRIDQETLLLAERRAKAVRAWVSGKSFRKVAEELGTVSKSTVGNDIKHVFDSYRLLALQDAASHVARELCRLAVLEESTWSAWERSMGAATERESAKSAGKTPWERSKIKSRERDGNPLWMRLLQGFWDRRCKLLGLLKAEDFRHGGDGLPPCKFVSGFDPISKV